MASPEGIRSPFSLQPSARSPKLRLYENLFLWNQGVDQLVALLRGMEKLSFARKSALQCAQAGIEEVRADVNADFLEEQAEYELDDAGRFWRQRRAYEKEREDPDDVYINVLHREEERKKQGLPPRIGVVPYSAVADEERRIEEEQGRKQQRSKRSKVTPKAKSTSQEKSNDKKMHA
jgi:hypothetical protein